MTSKAVLLAAGVLLGLAAAWGAAVAVVFKSDWEAQL